MRMSGSVRAAIWKRLTKKQTNMKSKTESIISALRVLARDIKTDDGVVNACLEEAAGRLEELHRELIEAIIERNKTVADLIKQRDDALKNQKATTVVRRVTTRLEPSRLEIAALMLAAMCGSQYTWTNAEGIALRKADTLIALAKEAQS